MPSLSNPLQQAVFRGCLECIRVLVETSPYYRVDEYCGPEGLLPIHIASREGHINVLRYLQLAGANLHGKDALHQTALHHAAIGGQLRAVRWLLRHEAKINTLDIRGRSPIQVAADHDHMEIVSLLAKHASSVTTCLTLSSSIHTSKTSPSTATTIAARNHHHNNNSHLKLYGQSQTNLHSKDNDTNNSHNNNNSHPIVSNCISSSDDPKVSPTCVDSSSSGNSSLATTSGSNSPSLSPSATCSCSSSETSDKSVSSADDENYSNKKSIGSTSAQSVASFFLHPPKSSISSKISGNIGVHKRQESQAPFYLHIPLPVDHGKSEIPSNLNNKSSVHFAESDVEIHALESMAPVTPVSATDFLPCKGREDDEKLRASSEADSSGASTSSSPSPPPPQAKTVKIQSLAPGNENLQISNSVRNSNTAVQIHIKGPNSRPPPPPPPMPKFETTDPFHGKQKETMHPKMIPQEQDEKPCYIYNNEENDYEDIDDVHNHMAHNLQEKLINTGSGELIKLNRTVSAPAGSATSKSECADAEKAGESEHKVFPISPKGIVPGIIHGLGGKVRVPFIPPNFPDPPKDALIKPSEYLKSIQKPQSKSKYGSTGPKYSCSNGNSTRTSTPKVEDGIRILGNCESTSNPMPPVSEETNMEDEFEEINPERINGSQIESGNKTSSRMCNGHKQENGHHLSDVGTVRSEQLMKVTLRKTPMTRTNSAPPLGLGRVLPDIPSDQNSDQVKRSKEINSNNNGVSGPLNVNKNIQNVQMATMSRAAVIAELSESSQLGGVREWKDELRRRQNEQEKADEKEMAQYYSPLNFVAEIPSTDGTGVPIPPWKRQMLAKKAAEKARKEAEEQRKIEAEAKRTAAIPPWRRQLLQRRESDGKYAQ